MPEITFEQYAGPYLDHPDFKAECREAATTLLYVVNEVLSIAAEDGVKFDENPQTKSLVSRSGNGGFRPQDCKIGAAKSKHKTGHGVDVRDPVPARTFTRWCYTHSDELKKRGLCVENVRWTLGWVHLQDVPPGPLGSKWRIDFIPSPEPPQCKPLPEQV